jgi:multisubunit Na+/H+ antiporter MnhB subunit
MKNYLQLVILLVICALLLVLTYNLTSRDKYKGSINAIYGENIVVEGSADAITHMIGLMAATCACGTMLEPPPLNENEQE